MRILICGAVGFLLLLTAAVEAAVPHGEPGQDAQRPVLRVEKRGRAQPAPSVLLIPGLACGGGVWDGTAATLGEEYAVYVLTLAGIDGVPPVAPPRAEKWCRAITDLVRDEKLDRPVIVGHSFGVQTAVRAAAAEPALFGGVIAVDGRPVEPLPPDGQTPEQRRAQVDANAGVMRLAAGGPQWEDLLRMYIRPMARDPRDAERVVQMALRSDRETVIDATRQHAEDIRPQLERLREMPLTLVLPIPPTVRREAEVAAFKRSAEPEWREAFRGAEHLQIRYVPDANHCLMFDQPHAFGKLLIEELRTMKRRTSSADTP